MFSRSRIALVLALLLSLILAVPAFAGGWAIITLDDVPTNVVAGQSLTVGFRVLQHGQTPVEGLSPTVRASLYEETKFVVDATPEGKPGHYIATLTFPKEGEWEWSIQAFNMSQKMPVLNVATPLRGEPVLNNEPVVVSVPSVLPLLIVRFSALGIGVVGLAFALLRRSRFAMVLTGLCLVVGVGSFAMNPAVPAVEAQSQSSYEVKTGSTIPLEETGSQLFIAKGCIVCHVNEKASTDSSLTLMKEAPNLTKFSASLEALRMRLENPKSVNADTWMPDLDLSDAEIEALIVFINSK